MVYRISACIRLAILKKHFGVKNLGASCTEVFFHFFAFLLLFLRRLFSILVALCEKYLLNLPIENYTILLQHYDRKGTDFVL